MLGGGVIPYSRAIPVSPSRLEFHVYNHPPLPRPLLTSSRNAIERIEWSST